HTACKCNRKASQCEWDPILFRNTGSGTRCLNCADNTEGLHCEKCIADHYRQTPGGRCLACGCDRMGSSCDDQGRCRCKAEGVIGDKCDRCQPGFYALSSSGCKRCMCDMAGSRDMCHSKTGKCNCKYNVEGTNCNYCKPGHFNLDVENPMGCSACFCYGHSSVCKADSGYSKDCITSAFGSDTEGWKAQHRNGHDLALMRSSSSQDIIIEAKDQYPVYFIAPAKFTGHQVLSYGQNLSFTFYVERNEPYPSVEDLILEGETQTLNAPITAFHHCRGHLDDVVLYTARPGVGQRPAEWVERCTCPTGYEGRFCEQCATGYTRHQPELGPYSECAPCNCNGHSNDCDPETGSCYPSDVAPVTCPDGYYTDPDNLSSCVKCPCPSRVGCTVSPATRDVVCMGCPPKTMGSRCEMCEEGYFGKPLAGRPCQPCMCNGNTDPNSVGNCDQDTGECLKCLYGTTGPHCERCKEGFLGNALNPQPSEKCKLCRCDPRGSWSSQCRSDGTCDCKPGVFGYYNSTTGCQECPSCYQAVLNKVIIMLILLIILHNCLWDTAVHNWLLHFAHKIYSQKDQACSNSLCGCIAVADFNGRVLNNQTAAEDALSKIPEISRTIDQANSKTKQAEDNLGNAVNTANEAKKKARKADGIADDVLKVQSHFYNPVAINSSRLILVEQTLQGAKNQLNNGLKVKLRELEQAAASQKDTIAAFDRDIEDIRGDIKNLEEIRDAFPDGCFNAAAIEKQ
uniref:Laminin EGF-like domain-containing protein n=1 Tax=Callorhinchus milii TaxID=7868 RepID=A0A4W3KCB7_CALMI